MTTAWILLHVAIACAATYECVFPVMFKGQAIREGSAWLDRTFGQSKEHQGIAENYVRIAPVVWGAAALIVWCVTFGLLRDAMQLLEYT